MRSSIAIYIVLVALMIMVGCMNVHAQEARAGDAVSEGDFIYTESTSASGFINSFAKTMLYQDSALRI